MPYISNYNLSDEEKKKQQGLASDFNISNNNSTTFNQSQQTNAPKPVANSGSWVNLQKYLDANSDNSAKMGDKITSNLNSDAKSASDKINALQSPGSVDAKTFDDVNKDFYSNSNASKNDYASFKTTGGYNGPSDIYNVNGYTDAQSAFSKANTNLNNSKTEEGRKSLLQDTYARPNYSYGSKTLDNLLLQNDKTNKEKFENVQNSWNGLTNLIDKKTEELNNQIASNVKNAASNKQNIAAYETQAKNSILDPIQARTKDYNNSRAAKQSDVHNDLTDTTLNDNTLGLLGLSDGQQLYDLNLNNYVNYNQSLAGIDNMANADERAKWSALASLIDDPTMTQITSGDKAINPVSFNKDQFMKDYAGKDSEYNNKLNTLNSEKSSLENEFNQLYNEWQSGNFLNESLEDMYRQLDMGAKSPTIQRMRDIQTRLSQIPNEQNNLNNMYQSSRRIQRG